MLVSSSKKKEKKKKVQSLRYTYSEIQIEIHQVLQQGSVLNSGKHTNISKRQHWHTSTSIARGIYQYKTRLDLCDILISKELGLKKKKKKILPQSSRHEKRQLPEDNGKMT